MTQSKAKPTAAQQTTTVTLPKRLYQRLEKLAKACGRTPDAVVTRILKDRMDYEEWFVKEVAKGLADAEAGRCIPHEKFWEELEKAQRSRKAKSD